MQLSHTRPLAGVSFDEPNLVSSAGLVPLVGLAEGAGLRRLADERLSVRTDNGANAGRKVAALVAGMVAGADSVDDLALLRHGGMKKIFDGCYAPSTMGQFLRAFRFGHVRQLDAVASRFLVGLGERNRLTAGVQDYALVDADDAIVEVHGYAKQRSGYGYSGVRGLNALLATVNTTTSAPVIVARRLRKGSCGAKRLVAEELTLRRLREAAPQGGEPPRTLLRADSAFYGAADAWTTIEYPDGVYDETAGVWISRAEVAEVPFTAFGSRNKAEQVPGRLVVRRIPDLNADAAAAGQEPLFTSWRFHALFTTSNLDAVSADKTHRQHAIIEQVHADLKNSALAHLPSGVSAANAAWLVLAVMAFTLTRAAGTLTGTRHAKATTGTIRRQLVHVPARIASSARRLVLRLPTGWPWQTAWTELFTRSWRTTSSLHNLTTVIDATTRSRRTPNPGRATDRSSNPMINRPYEMTLRPQDRRWIEALAPGLWSVRRR